MGLGQIGQYFLILFVCSLPLGILYYGWVGYKTILKQNPCEMTYSRAYDYQVKLEWAPENFRLYQVAHPVAKMDFLRPNPVLFIPGHKGMYTQVRSFASHMHNEDDFFQYFALDFHEDVVGLHGRDLLHKAAFVNEALRVIKKLYSKQNPNVKITILGHSYGGMIGKTSVLLSNHPNCVVNNIFMLGTPLIRPVGHSPDATLVIVFNQVNKAWFNGYYLNASCGNYSISSRTVTHKVAFQPSCTACLKNITVVNLSGGEVDFEVDPKQTNLYEITARPRNTSSIPSNKQGVFGFSKIISTVTGIRNTVVKTVFGLFSSVTGSSNTTSNSTATTNTTTQQTTVIIEEEPKEPEVSMNPNSSYAFITKDIWSRDIIKYHEPRHICYRSTQFNNVGFPIDHYALLWCKQFLAEVSTGMRKLITSGNELPVHEIFDYSDPEYIDEKIEEVQPLKITELSKFVIRNASNALFQHAAINEEAYMLGTLEESFIWLTAVKFYLRYWHLPITYFVALLIFSLSMKTFALITTLSAECDEDSNAFLLDFQLLLVLYRKLKIKGGANVLGYVMFAIFSVVVYFLRSVGVPQLRSIVYQGLYHVLAFIIAIGLRTFCIGLIQFGRWILNKITKRESGKKNTVSRKGGNKNKSSSSGGGGSRSSSSSSSSSSASKGIFKFIKNYFPEILLLTAWISIFMIFCYPNERTSFLYYLSSFAVVTYVIIILEFIYISFIQSKNHFTFNIETMQYIDEELILIIFWLLITALPSFGFSLQLLIRKESSIAMEYALYDILGPDQLQYALILLAAHLLLRVLSSKRLRVNIQSMPSLATFFDGIITPGGSNLPAPDAITGECLHEDGGKDAIFEIVEKEKNVQYGKHSICMNTTYRVISCNCQDNKEFKTLEEWCEFCKCHRCNPAAASYYYNQQRQQDQVYGPRGPLTKYTVNLDLCLGLSLLAIAGFMAVYGEDVYIGLYATACVATAIVIRGYFKNNYLEFHL